MWKKKGIEDTHVYFPVKVLNGIRKVAARERRSVSAQIVIAVEEYVRKFDESRTNGSKERS